MSEPAKRKNMEKTKQAQFEKDNGIKQLLFKFLPFWPLFLITTLISGSYFYFKMKYTVPIYETNASVLIKDEKKGQEDSKIEDVLNVFGSKKIVENEQEIFRSNSIVSQVVRNLHLYANITKQKGWRGMSQTPAYLTCPLQIVARYPDALTPMKKTYFTFNVANNTVTFNNTTYTLDQWINTSSGEIRFSKNPLHQPEADDTNDEVHYYFTLNDVKNVTTGLIGSLTVAPSNKQSSVINITLKDPVPQKAELVINELIRAYNQSSIERKNQTALKTLAFIEDRLVKVSRELDSVESSIQKFRNKTGTVNLGEQGRLYLESQTTNDRQMTTMDLQMTALNEVEKYLSSKSTEGALAPATMNVQDATLNNLLEKYYTTQQQYEKMRRTNGENNPSVLALREELNNSRPAILENIQNQKRNIQAGLSSLQDNSNRFNSMLSSIPKKEKDLLEVSRQQNIKNDIYSFLLQKKEEISYSISSIIPDCDIVSKPTTGISPISPKKPFMAMLALILPMVVSVSVVMIKDMFNHKIMFRTDIEKYTDIPILGELVQEKFDHPLVTASGNRSFIVEQFRQIRSILKHQGTPPGNIHRLLVSSSIKGEGKSFVSGNLALSFARSGKKVILLEMDLHQPKIREMYDLPEGPGICEFLESKVKAENIIHPSGKHENLSIITAGESEEDPTELLANGKLELLFNYLDKQYDLVIVDTAPFKALTDAYTIAAYMDLLLVVVRHNHTPNKLLERINEDMEAQNIHNVAIIFNGVKQRGLGKYAYGYGYGYGYDQKSNYNDYHKKIKKVS